MGSATREALARARAALSASGESNGLLVGRQLFEAARVVGNSPPLRSMLSDPSVTADDKIAVVQRIFASLSVPARTLLADIASARWSSQDDLLAGVEEIAIRSVAGTAADGVSIESELFAFGSAVSSDADLELAVGSKLGATSSKSQLVAALIGKSASPQTLLIVDHLVQQPRGRRIGELVRTAASVVADEAGFIVATVTTAAPIATSQTERLSAALAGSYGRPVRINHVIEPTIVGGIRVQVGDDVIDGSVATRISDLRLQLAG